MGILSLIGRDTDLSGVQPDEAAQDMLYPDSPDAWAERYAQLERAYVGEVYTTAEMKAQHLFRALDEDGKVLAETRRLTRDVSHVVDTDANSLTGGTLVLVAADDAPTDALDVGEAVWERSDLQEQKGRWGRRFASLGDLHIEAVLGSDGKPRLVYYDPMNVHLTYDAETGGRLERADIRIQFFDPPVLDANGAWVDVQTKSHVYVRQITADEITVYIDGELQAEQSGKNVLGVVSLVHVPFIPWKEPEHGLWAASGLEAPLSLIDSLLTQVLAIGTRHANPLLLLQGFTLAAGTDVMKFGRVISGSPKPTDGDAKYIEIQASIVRLLEAVEQERLQVRATLPEFLFSESGANESGEARSYRAAAFEAKIEDVRGRLYPALARLTQYAYHLEHKQAYDAEKAYYSIDGPPVLPRNAATELAAIHEVVDRKGITREDYVRHLQRLDLVDESEDIPEYVRKLDEGLGDRAGAFFAPEAGAEVQTDGLQPGTTVDAGAVSLGVDKAQDTALNGAQVQAAQGIVESVAAGQLPRETGVAMLTLFFNIPADQADALMGEVGRSFTATDPEAVAAAPAALPKAPPAEETITQTVDLGGETLDLETP